MRVESSLKLLVLSGETFPFSLWEMLSTILPKTTILNLYGSTEVRDKNHTSTLRFLQVLTLYFPSGFCYDIQCFYSRFNVVIDVPAHNLTSYYFFSICKGNSNYCPSCSCVYCSLRSGNIQYFGSDLEHFDPIFYCNL
jgi:hypothetical protein